MEVIYNILLKFKTWDWSHFLVISFLRLFGLAAVKFLYPTGEAEPTGRASRTNRRSK